jgi:hypothetical protein
LALEDGWAAGRLKRRVLEVNALQGELRPGWLLSFGRCVLCCCVFFVVCHVASYQVGFLKKVF